MSVVGGVFLVLLRLYHYYYYYYFDIVFTVLFAVCCVVLCSFVLFYFPQRRLPIFFSQVWGVLVLRLSRSYPEMENLHVLQKFYEEGRPAMFVANHCSWMDIPFLGATVGWRNYKIVSKKELGAVPILGSAIRIGGNIMVDRLDRKSQLQTLKQGINYLKKVRIMIITIIVISYHIIISCRIKMNYQKMA